MEFSPSFERQDGVVRFTRSGDGEELVGLDVFGLEAGHALVARSSVQPRRLDFYSLVHVVEGRAWFWTEENARNVVQAGDAVLFCPDTVFDFSAASGGAVVDYLCFSGMLAKQLKADKLLYEGVCSLGVARRLLPVIRYTNEGTREGALRARSALLHLLTELEIERSHTTVVPSRIASLIDAIRRHPETWRDSQQMATYCHLSEAQLRRVFKKETGMSPKIFQDTVRARKAEELLKGGFSVNIVSDLLGYPDPFHFSRRFKAIIGKAPSEFLSGASSVE